MEIQVFRNENSSQTNANLHYSNYSYSGLIPNERALNDVIGNLIQDGGHVWGMYSVRKTEMCELEVKKPELKW